ncbi:MAG TPA: VWA domain-containing protein [Acidobacteriota bacterium]|nr:VWA domain-containing protein [Acidobacteriota bacterium]
MRVALLTVALFFAFCYVAGSQNYEVTVTTIRVWVAVEGKAAGTLTKEDFDVYEDGKRMEPTCFERSQLQPSSEPAPPVDATSTSAGGENEGMSDLRRKRIVLMVDQLNTTENEYLFIKKKILDFLDQMEGKSEVMLTGVPPYEEMTDFTKNFDEIRKKLERLTASRDRDQRATARRRDIRNTLETHRSDAMAIAHRLAMEGKMEEEQEVLLVLDAIKSFQKSLNKRDQQEHTVVIFISGGLNSHPGQKYVDMIPEGTPDDEAFRELQRGANDFGRIMEQAIGSLNRDNVTVYTINTRGQVDPVDNITESDKKYAADQKKMSDYAKDTQELLDKIAQDTGGLSYRNSLNFKRGFDAVLDDLDHQYLLCYVAPEHKEPGDYHKIKVTSRTKGIKVRYRAGYMD